MTESKALDFSKLNLAFVEETTASAARSDLTEEARKCLHLYNKMWAALGKYLVQAVHQSAKAIEIPGFLLIGPQIESFTLLRDPLAKGDAKESYSVKDTVLDRKILIGLNQKFLTEAGV